MKFGRIMIGSLSLTLFASTTFAQQANGMWGTGVYGGMQSCPYQVSGASGASNFQDEIRDLQSRNQEATAELRRKKSEKAKLDRTDLKKSKDTINKYFQSDYADAILSHMDNSFSCTDYKGMSARGEESEIGASEGGKEVQGTPSQVIQGFSGQEFARVCDPNKKGNFVPAVCDNAKFKNPDVKRLAAQDCRGALNTYRKSITQSQKLQAEIEFLQETIKDNRERIAEANSSYREEMREQLREQTESGICVECMAQSSTYAYQSNQQPDWAGVATNVTMGLLASYMGYQTNKMTASYNASIGYPTQSYPAWGYGFPYLMAGMYGALGGGTGQGSFGCGSGMYGSGNANGPYGMMGPFGMGGLYGGTGGAFGYPSAMGGYSLGGGMYPNGMGPWGMAGPWGLMGNMSGYPGAMGSMMGYPGALASGGVFTGSMMGSYPGSMMGSYPGSMMGSMMGSYPGAMVGGIGGAVMGAYPGSMMGSYPGSMMGSYPGSMMGSMMGSYPGAMVGGIGGGVMGAYPGSMMGGMTGSMMGAYPGSMVNAFGGGVMGAYPGSMMGGMTGSMMGSMTGSADGGLGQLQMQQQLMQMQMQQWQTAIEQQRKYQEDQISRQRVVVSLQQELQSLVYRIQQVQMGAGSSGYLGGTSGGTTTLLPGTSTGTGTTILPGSGTATTPLGTGR